MTFRLSDFGGLAGLEVLRDGHFETPGKLSTPLAGLCVPLRSANYLADVNDNVAIVAVITTRELADGLAARLAVGVAEHPDAAHSEILAKVAEVWETRLRARVNAIDSTAIIDPGASIASHAVEIGPRVRVGPNVVIAPGVSIEADCVLHPGVTLGVPGFNTGVIAGRQRIVPQLGGVRLKPFVELLANVCVARALFGGETTLGEETVADNLVYIAHDVQVGRRVQICALANILGRVSVGDGAYIGPSAVVRNGLNVGARAKISLGAVVTRDVAEGSVVSGNFAIAHERFLGHLRTIR
jgi:UDP-3-O-[3-hydroxymyristoyl] glucosamine N-acyltransferase